MESEEELELVSRAQAGDREAFAAIVRGHQARLLGLCLSMLGDPAEAQDAAQDAFLKAFRSLAAFRGSSSLSTWLHRVASNVCLDRLRARARRRTESWDELVEREGERIERLLAPSPGPEPTLEARDLVRRILAQLPEDQRIVLVLRETQGLSYEELAEVLDCSVDAVKARLRRARQALEKKLRHFLGSADV